MQASSHPVPWPSSGQTCPTSIAQAGPDAVRGSALMNRVGRVLQDVNAGRPVSDEDMLQHVADTARLVERCYSRFEAFGDPADREEAVLWMHRRHEAIRALSPAWKAAREAEIQAAIVAGIGYFQMEARGS